MRDNELISRLAKVLATDFRGLEAGAGSFISFEAVVLRERDITSKVARRIGRNRMANLNEAVRELDPTLFVRVSSRAPWGGLSFLVAGERKESRPRPGPQTRNYDPAIARDPSPAPVPFRAPRPLFALRKRHVFAPDRARALPADPSRADGRSGRTLGLGGATGEFPRAGRPSSVDGWVTSASHASWRRLPTTRTCATPIRPFTNGCRVMPHTPPVPWP